MNKNIIIAILVVAILVIGGYFLVTAMQQSAVNNTQNTNGQNNNQNNNTVNQPKMYEVTYTDAGYAPAELTIRLGDTVVFKNESSGGMWTASAMHPSHMVYGGASLQDHCPDIESNDFDQCQSSQSGTAWSFTFNKVGSWGYHNHVKANHFGKIIVQ